MADPPPYPATASPTANPRRSGNHLAITGMGVAYPRPLPIPPITPKNILREFIGRLEAQMENPMLTSKPTRTESQQGPSLACSRPSMIDGGEDAITAPPH